MSDSPASYTTNYSFRKWNDHNNPGAEGLNANWDDIDTVLFYMIDTRGAEISGKEEQTIKGDLILEEYQTGDGRGVLTANKIKVKTIEAATSGGINIESLNVLGDRLHGLANPVDVTEAATKGYVDQLVQGLDWKESVLDKDILDPSTLTPNTGDRYLIDGVGAGDWAGHDKEIAEYDGSAWQWTVPTNGTTVNVEDENKYYTYDGTNWILMASIFSHNQLANLQGGQTGEYYHLNNSEYTELHNWLDNVSLFDDGKVEIPTTDGGKLVINNDGFGEIKKVGGDVFWSLSEETFLQALIGVKYVEIYGMTGGPNYIFKVGGSTSDNKIHALEVKNHDNNDVFNVDTVSKTISILGKLDVLVNPTSNYGLRLTDTNGDGTGYPMLESSGGALFLQSATSQIQFRDDIIPNLTEIINLGKTDRYFKEGYIKKIFLDNDISIFVSGNDLYLSAIDNYATVVLQASKYIEFIDENNIEKGYWDMVYNILHLTGVLRVDDVIKQKAVAMVQQSNNPLLNHPFLGTVKGLWIKDDGKLYYFDGTNNYKVVGNKAISTKTANYTITLDDYTILADGSANTVTITLPDATTCQGQIFNIKAIDITNTVIVETNGTQTIDNASNYTFNSQYESITVQSDGSNWWIV